MVGNVSGKGSLLGEEELNRYFPDRKVNVFVATWNMNGLVSSYSSFLFPLCEHRTCISVQNYVICGSELIEILLLCSICWGCFQSKFFKIVDVLAIPFKQLSCVTFKTSFVQCVVCYTSKSVKILRRTPTKMFCK